MPEYTVTLSLDGNMWCALNGPDLMAGTAGFGPTPADALVALAHELFGGAELA